MISLPSPLHPAIVHFPVVLITLGAGVAVAAAFLRRWHLPQIAAALLILGAVGAIVAEQTGDADKEIVGQISPVAEALLDEHEDWAERTQTVSVIAAIFAIASIILIKKFPRVSHGIAIGCAIVALGAAWCVYETGHRGGLMVYKHGVGVNIDAPGAGLPLEVAPTNPSLIPEQDNDDKH